MSEVNRATMFKGAVTFLDVVGQVGIWQRRKDAIYNLLDIVDTLQDEAKRLTGQSLMYSKLMGEYRGLDVTTDVKSISDTIVFLTPLGPDLSLDIHGNLCRKAIILSIENRIPLRGATSFGEFNQEKNVMIGPAVDEAAAWHENIDWFGSILTPSALFLNRHTAMDCWKEYDVHCKQGNLKTACANWVPLYKKNRSDLCDAFIEMGPIIPEFAMKYTNTLEFYDYCSGNAHNP